MIEPVNLYLRQGLRHEIYDLNLQKIMTCAFTVFVSLKLLFESTRAYTFSELGWNSVLSSKECDETVSLCLRACLIVSALGLFLLRNMTGVNFQHLREPIFHTEQEALEMCLKNGLAILHLEPRWRIHKKIAQAASWQDARSFKFFDASLRSDLDVFLAALVSSNKEPKLLSYLTEPLASNRQLIKIALSHGVSLEGAKREFKDDEELVYAAVKYDGLQLRCASERLKSRYKIVNCALMQNKESLKYAHRDFKTLYLVWQAFNRQLDQSSEISQQDLNKELALRLVLQNF